MDEVTTRDILRKVALKSVRGFRQWMEIGLIPRPTVRRHPKGQGRIATWPASVIDRCIEIRRLTRENLSLVEIFKRLGPWSPPQKRKRGKQPSLRESEVEAHLFRLRELANKALRRFGRACVNFPDQAVLSRTHFDRALKLIKRGRQPLLLVTSTEIDVLSDRSFPKWLASKSDEHVFGVILLQGLLTTDALAADDPDESQQPSSPRGRELRVIVLD